MFRQQPGHTVDSKGQTVTKDANVMFKQCLLRMRQAYRSRQDRNINLIWTVMQAVFGYLNEEIYASELAITSQRVMREKMQKQRAEQEAAEGRLRGRG